MLRILGVDPGTLRCGYAVIEQQVSDRLAKPQYIECGVIELPSQESIETRLRLLAADLREVIEEFHPSELSIESAFSGVNVRSALLLGQARGVILLVGAEAGLGCAEYPPATIKKTVCGHGRATKQEVQKVVSWLCKLASPPPADAADAVAIALCHAFHRPQHKALGGRLSHKAAASPSRK
ncbi:MAG TPA: crossover junction endodeoxyribonuclease RuvC [Pseudomonadota bacterium]|nr:crossover junction endodeoxyribonuclease RuvC [Pseudomonadota bacterium]